VLVVLGLLFAGGGAFLLTSSKGDDDDEQTATTEPGTDTTEPTEATGTTEATTTTAPGGEITAFDLEEGDCWNQPTDSEEVSSATVVGCDTPHDLEVYEVYQVTFTEFPGEEEIGSSVESDCIARFAAFVGVEYQDSTLNVISLYPTQASWDMGDREATCSVGDPAGQTTGSLRGSGR
jgi:Septum formation